MRWSLLFVTALLWAGPAPARIIAVNPAQQKQLGIRVAPVRPAFSQTTVSVLARVTPAPGSRLPVAAPFAGTVKSLLRLEGDAVRKGERLIAIASAEMHAARARQLSSAARYHSAAAAAARAKALVAEGIAPASRAEEANAEAAAAAADLAASRRVMTQVSGSENSGYYLLAPADGRVAAINVSAGDQLSAMQPVLEIDTRRELWLQGALPAPSVGQVAAGDAVLVEGLAGAHGQVVAAGSTIDPRTRSAMVRVRLAPGAALVSGQTVRISIQRRAATGSFTVPRSAVTDMKDGPTVFVLRGAGFEPVSVRLLARGAQDATIQGRLGPQDKVAVTGITELKSAGLQD